MEILLFLRQLGKISYLGPGQILQYQKKYHGKQ